MENNNISVAPKVPNTKIKQNDRIYAVKVRTEGNGLGVLKTIIVLALIAVQFLILAFAQMYFLRIFTWYMVFSLVISIITCVYVLASDYHGQAKATWVLFLLVCSSFGYIFYFLSDKHILFAFSRKKYKRIDKEIHKIQTQNNIDNISGEVKNNCDYLYNSGGFATHTNSKCKYFPSGAQFFDSVLKDLESAKEFIFMEYYIISDGVLLKRFLDILKKKAQEGVDVRIIYDDMGCHGTLKAKTKKEIISSGIKLKDFNRMVPVMNIALNLRDHRKIVVIDGKVAYTGGTNLADEYVNEKLMHGYWKDSGIKIKGKAADNLTIAFLGQWRFLTEEEIDYNKYINKAKDEENVDGIVTPFVSGPNYDFSISQNIYANEISHAKEKLYIMTPYFIPDETIKNLIINKARAGVDVRIILPHVADKKFVYIVSRNNAEKLLKFGVKVYTMTSSFVHSKIVLTENSAIVGSINMDLRSFYQQFESAVFTNQVSVLKDINKDFEKTIAYSKQVDEKNMRRRKVFYRMLAGLFNLISPFM
ncbi:MAG: cardiolipin synthase [Clostridia bacterium]|nr:cardiolipin synthase [Clostridia bacterium]